MTKAQQLLRIKNEFRTAHGNAPASPRVMLEWAAKAGLFKLDMKRAFSRAVDELANAMRGEVTLDGHGNEIRVNLAFETEQGWQWDQRDTISRPHMELNVAHSRRMSYSDIKATVLSVRDYNEHHPNETPLQYSLNFWADLADEGIILPSSSVPVLPVERSVPVVPVSDGPPAPARLSGPRDDQEKQQLDSSSGEPRP